MKRILLLSLLAAGCGQQNNTQPRQATASADKGESQTTANVAPEANAAAMGISKRQAAPQVQTPSGAVRGGINGTTHTFIGIPYALPPTGNRRFKKPEPFPAWTGVRDAFSPGAQCPQLEDGDIGNEDCLFLNVYVPQTSVKTGKPVMVFIHGGAFDNGSGYNAMSDDGLYEGSKLAALGDVILVTMNYRLGALGFLAHPALTSAEGASGINGILDQIMALEWVKTHIASFGGDPANVTIFGESAGAMSTCSHVAQHYKRGLFKRAIMQSGNCQSRSIADAHAQGEALVKKLGCDSADPTQVVACLRDPVKVPAKTFVTSQVNLDLKSYTREANYALAFAPVVNGVLYDERPIDVLMSGKGQKVDMITGSNRYEVPGFLFTNVKTQDDLVKYLAASDFSDSEINQLLALYPLSEHGSEKNRAGAIATDVQFTCPKQEITRAMLQQGNKVYNFSYDLLGAFHGTELPYVFQKMPATSVNMKEMGQLWTSFGAKGAPVAGKFVWKPTSLTTQTDLRIDSSKLRHLTGYRVSQCQVINQYQGRMK